MRVSKKIQLLLLIVLIVAGGLALAELFTVRRINGLVSSADAEVGRPLTPVSVAGVARRTARRN